MKQNQDFLKPVSHEATTHTKEFKIRNSRFKLFFVGFVALCENWVLVLTQEFDSKFKMLVCKVL